MSVGLEFPESGGRTGTAGRGGSSTGRGNSRRGGGENIRQPGTRGRGSGEDGKNVVRLCPFNNPADCPLIDRQCPSGFQYKKGRCVGRYRVTFYYRLI